MADLQMRVALAGAANPEPSFPGHAETVADRSGVIAIDFDRMCRHRLARVRDAMEARDCDALLLFDPVNIRYASGARNMQIWAMRNAARYCLILRGGPLILFEIGGRPEPAAGLVAIDEIRRSRPWFYYYAGAHAQDHARDFAREIAGIMADWQGGADRRLLAVDRCDALGIAALQECGLEPIDAQALMEQARRIKSGDEIGAIRQSIAVCELGIDRMRSALQPGISENALWSILHQTNIEKGGEYIDTRLLSSGTRTNPWYQEASAKLIAAGELVTFDCDLIGPLGYGADLSGAFVCGRDRASPAQRELYRRAYDQIEHNSGLLAVGTPLREIVAGAKRLPEQYHQFHRIAHGNGMATGEFPAVGGRPGFAEPPIHDGVLEEGMVLCVGSYAGLRSGGEGVKLERQFVLRASGPVALSRSLKDPAFIAI